MQDLQHRLHIQDLQNKIRKFSDPILTEKCESVEFGDEAKQIGKELARVLATSKTGVGLAAPQIGYTKRIIAIRSSINDPNVVVMINPDIIKISDAKFHVSEGCLSYPGVVAIVERYKEVTAAWTDVNGEKQTKDMTGLESVVMQHELFHLDGRCANHDAWIQHKELESRRLKAIIDGEPEQPAEDKHECCHQHEHTEGHVCTCHEAK